jgi:hypothetical protein
MHVHVQKQASCHARHHLPVTSKPCTEQHTHLQQHTRCVSFHARPLHVMLAMLRKNDSPTPRRDNALTPSTTSCRSSPRPPPSPRSCILAVSSHVSSTTSSPQHHRRYRARAHACATGRHCRAALAPAPPLPTPRLPGRLGVHATPTPPSYPRRNRTGSPALCRVVFSLAITELLRAPLCNHRPTASLSPPTYKRADRHSPPHH